MGGLSEADVGQLARMYCNGNVAPTPPPTTSCYDQSSQCPDYLNYCDSNEQVKRLCQQSCGHCERKPAPAPRPTAPAPTPPKTPSGGCVDKGNTRFTSGGKLMTCQELEQYCDHSTYGDLIQGMCEKS